MSNTYYRLLSTKYYLPTKPLKKSVSDKRLLERLKMKDTAAEEQSYIFVLLVYRLSKHPTGGAKHSPNSLTKSATFGNDLEKRKT